MNKVYWLFFFLLIGKNITAQTPKKSELFQNLVEEHNSSKNFTIESSVTKENRKTRQIAITVTASKRRFFKKRKTKIMPEPKDAVKEQDLDIDLIKAIENKEENNIEKFNTVDKIPLFKSCLDTLKSEQLKCFNNELMGFINENIIYPDEAINSGITGEVSINFVINTKGKADNVQVSGTRDSRILKKEVVKLINKLPKFSPAEKNGKPTPVEYNFKLNFSL